MYKRLFVLAALTLGALACDSYSENDLELVTGYKAKTMCTCLFVTGQTEQYCAAWSTENPPIASYRIDWDSKAVESQGLLLWGARARFVSERLGCVLE
ncbi:MAG: hypothetical protein JXR83_15170 [Deltaproteobacteria bacterium]|nr:hypothetical protein [Deltaproteobacteria bacterium]